ncbi:MAG: HD domain-containing protein [Spirochaetales bacterium]|nr:HD domain-containing protein [Spirochaetales bacterium]
MNMNDIDVYAVIKELYPAGSIARYFLVCHSESVARKALDIANRMDDPSIDRGLVYRGAMLHDIGMIFTDCPECGGTGAEPYFYHGVLGGDYLRSKGFEQLARFAERHLWMGLSREDIQREHIDLPPGTYMPETAEERLVCYADCFFSKVPRWLTTPKPVAHIVSKLPRYQAERFLAAAEAYGDCTHQEARLLLLDSPAVRTSS